VRLAEYQRAVAEASFAQHPSDALFHSLGHAERFRMYRHMIRSRLNGMAHVAYARSLTVAGAAAMDVCFDRYLEEQPPKSGLIRDVIADFGSYAARDAVLLAKAPAHLACLLRFEESKWRLAYVPCAYPKVGLDGVRELDFDGALVLNPAHACLALRYRVHMLEQIDEVLPADPFTLLMYRPEDTSDVRWYATDPFFAALLAQTSSAPAPLSELVRSVAQQQGCALDEELLDTLSTSLTLAMQRGLVLGVRDLTS
jgi:hypothetical protein